MLQLNNFNWYEDFCIEIVYIGIYYSLFCWTGNWMKNIKRRSVLKTGNLTTWGTWQREICFIPQAKWDEPAKNSCYGKTFGYFYTRAAERMMISNLTGKPLKNIKQSAISDHLIQCNCTINFDDFSILATECNKFKLLLRESLLIKHE